jgi:hypothetical protein
VRCRSVAVSSVAVFVCCLRLAPVSSASRALSRSHLPWEFLPLPHVLHDRRVAPSFSLSCDRSTNAQHLRQQPCFLLCAAVFLVCLLHASVCAPALPAYSCTCTPHSVCILRAFCTPMARAPCPLCLPVCLVVLAVNSAVCCRGRAIAIPLLSFFLLSSGILCGRRPDAYLRTVCERRTPRHPTSGCACHCAAFVSVHNTLYSAGGSRSGSAPWSTN